MASSSDIRSLFLDFFARNGHAVVASSALVPANDPTLLFTNAGMVQFKNVFTGIEKRSYVRAATSQKCVRAGGKHNDLENVGYTARHHTFFEMLGNFSFGDYFKERAIELAWTLLTKEYGLAPERLLATVYAEDDEAARLWKKIAGISESRIIRIASADNFWSMGDTGPCGPCSEIFYDHGPHIPGGPPGSADEGGDRFVEIWNLVFMQFEQAADGKRTSLPKPSIDTGMGLERLSAVLQGQHDNYDTDILRALIRASAEAAHTSSDGAHAVAHRVIADHLRAVSFLIADGVLPANEGRGYVLRRIMRRAMRHAHMMGCEQPLLFRLVPALVREMGQAFPELVRAQALVTETLKLEEMRFKDMLGRGLKLLDEETAMLAPAAKLPGEVAFKLYDTFGFPLDLTADVLRGRGREVDQAGFDTAMERQRADARRNWAGSGAAAEEQIWFAVRERVGATEFLGYSTESAEAHIVALVADGREVSEARAGEEIAVVVNQTPFYGESGGQVGDSGILFTAAGAELAIDDTQKRRGDLHVHLGKLGKGQLANGDVVELRVDGERRGALRAHHSATHLLHEALRRRLGAHVTQKGSLVAPERLRFDVSHQKPLGPEERADIETEVNRRVRLNGEVTTRLMTPDAAEAAGAMALFGEKYGDEVRVVAMGGSDDQRFSIELCGGTHVRRTGDIGFFKIVADEALAAGVRRIEAVCGVAALAYVTTRDALLDEAARALRIGAADLPGRIGQMVEERKRLEREISDLRRKLATGGGAARSEAKEIAGLRFIGRKVEGVPAKDLKPMADELRKQVGSGVVALIGVEDGKASVVVSVTDDVTKTVSSIDLVKIAVTELGGKGGGGRPDMAQGGGPNVGAADAALAAVERALAERA